MKKTSQSSDEKSVGFKLPGYWTFFRDVTARRSVRDIRESLGNGSAKSSVDVVTNGSISPEVEIKEPSSVIDDKSSSKLENTDTTNVEEDNRVVITELETVQTIPEAPSNSGISHDVQTGTSSQEKSVVEKEGRRESTSEIVPDDVFWTEEEESLRNNSSLQENKQENTEGLAQSDINTSSDTLVASENETAQEKLDITQNRIENLQQNLATQVRPETIEVYKDSIAKNKITSRSVEQKQESKYPTKPVNNIATHSVNQNQVSKAPEKPVRVSWTTRLLQKLTEEEENKKKIRQEPKLQKPKRIVRFPQKKPPKAEKKEWPKFYPGIKKPETQTGQAENVSGIKLDTKDKDAYASLITQLSDPKEEEEEKKKNTKAVEVKDEARLQKVEEIRAAIAREECVTSSDDDSLVDMKEKPTGIRRLLPQNLFSRKEEYERPVLEPLLKRGDRVHPARPVHETAFLSRSQSSSPARENEHNSSRSKSMSPARDRRTLPDPARCNRTVPDAPKDAYYHSPPSRRKTSEASSASSTSTLVADNWNPLHVNLEYQAISGSPDIRRLQQQKQYGEIRRNDIQGQVPSGRLSAPPYQYNEYPKRRVTTPEPPRSSRRSLSQPPRQRNSLQVLPVSAQMKITSSSCDVNCKETQTNKSYIQQTSRQLQVKPIQHPQNKQISPEQYQNKHYRSSPGELNVSSPPVNMKYHHSLSGNRVKDSPSQVDYPNSPSQIQRSPSPASLNRQYSPERRPDDFNSHYQNIPAQYQRTISPANSLNIHRGSQHIQQQIPQHLDRSLSPLKYQSSPALQRSISPADSLNRQHNRPGSQQLHNKQSPQQLDRSLSPIRYQSSPSQLHRSLSPADSLHRQQHNRSGSELRHQKRSPQQLDRSLSPVRYQNNQEQLQRSLSPTDSLNRQAQLHRSISPADSLNRRAVTQTLQHQKPSSQQLDRSLSPVRYQNNQTQLQRSLSPTESLTKQQISPKSLARNDNQMTNRQYQNSPVQFIPRQYMNNPAQLSPQRLYQSSPALQGNLPPENFNRQYYGGPDQKSTDSLSRQYQKVPGQHTTDSLNRNLLNSPVDASQSRQFKKLSRQEVESLYWETQRLRAGLSSLSHQLNNSTTSLQVPTAPRPPYRVNSAQNVGNVYGTVLLKPQPLTPRARSVSPSPDRHLSTRSLSLPRDTNFSRGTPTRNTIGPIRTQPPIYEESEEVHLRHGNKGSKKKSNYTPIFKRGSLTCPIEDTVPSPYPKRVSFTSSGEQLYWPTRNGPAIEPPTRQRKSTTDSEEYSTYVNIPATMTAPNRPLPPVPKDVVTSNAQRWQQQSESESGSEAGEVQRILQQGYHGRGSYFRFPEEEWGADGKSRGTSGTEQSASNVGRDDEVRRSGGGGGRSGRRDEPRRHTLSGDHHHHQQGGALARSMDLEMSSKSQRRKSPLPRGYPPPSSAMLFDEDPGIMSEVETSSTGFRRGGKQRSSLPVVRTPSKTLERPLGLVFLQYRNETKRALLPNEITSIDTVKALFVRSFPKQLTMEYLDSPHVKIYIHDSSKDMFYELEDLRSHLRDIRDRSVLRLFESTDMNGGVLPGAGVGVVAPPMWDQDQSYFSEPEFDSEYQHQHIHKTKASSKSGSSGVPPQAPYYMTHSYPPGGATGAPGASATLPRGGPLLRAYSPAVAPPVPSDRIKTLPQTDRLHAESGYMSSPERGGPRAYPTAYPPGGPGYEDPYYSQYASRSGSITPVIDEEARIRVEHMERQLANLTGLVQKALTQTPTPREYLQVPPPATARDTNYRNGV